MSHIQCLYRSLRGRFSQALFASLLGVAYFFISIVWAQPQEDSRPLETTLARAYLFLLSRTTWPTDSGKTRLFCINRDHSLFDTFAKLLPTLNLGGKTYVMKSFDEGDVGTQKTCHVIALSQNTEFNKSVIRQVQNFPVLTISHETDITIYGGVIFIVYGQRLEPPKININELEKSDLHMDASVLNLSLKKWDKQ